MKSITKVVLGSLSPWEKRGWSLIRAEGVPFAHNGYSLKTYGCDKISNEWFLFWFLIIGIFLVILLVRGMSRMINSKIVWFLANKKAIMGELAQGITMKQGLGILFQGVLPDLQEKAREMIKGGL